MRASLLAVLAPLLAAASPARAEPCAVTLVISPPSVRDVVAKWVQAEPRCSVALEVRIVPTDGGFYVHARDARARVRERIVPDAQTAAVLITSWAADDTIAPGAAQDQVVIDDLSWTAPKLRGPEPGVLIERTVERPAPIVTRPAPTVAVRVDAPVARERITGRTLELAVMRGTSSDDTHHWGTRAAIDVMRHGRWRFGTSIALTHAEYPVYRDVDTGDLQTTHVSATGYVATTGTLGFLEARAHVGVGFVGTYLTGVLYDASTSLQEAYAWPDAFGMYPTVEAALHLRLIGDESWQLEVGPYVRWLGESFSPPMPAAERIDARGWETLIDVAVRWKR